MEALQSGRPVNKVIISDQLNKKTENELRQAAKRANSILQKVPKQKMAQLSKGRHQGIVAYVSSYEYVTVQDILHHAKAKDELPFLIILDEIEDPHNLGAILRTADATAALGIIIPNRRAVGLTQSVAKTSAGAIAYIQVAQVTNILQPIKQL